MSPTTRRSLFSFGAAALIGRALPTGARPVAALAAETGAVDVLDADWRAEEDPNTLYEQWVLFSRMEGCQMECVQVFLETDQDGSARMIFQPLRPHDESVKYAVHCRADGDRPMFTMTLDAKTMRGITTGFRFMRSQN